MTTLDKTTRSVGLGAVLIGAVVALGGCYFDFGSWHDSSSGSSSTGYYDPGSDFSAGNVDVQAGFLAGTMGDVTLSNEAWRTEGSYYSGYTEVTVEARNAGGEAAMTIVEVTGGLDNVAIVPGAVLEFDSSDPYSSGGVDVQVVGCSGPSSGSWVFDTHAQHTTMWVSEGSLPTTRRIDFVATFDDGYTRTQTQGMFEYTLF